MAGAEAAVDVANATASVPARAPSFLMVTGNDFRSKRKVNVHFIAQALRAYGQVRFFSIQFSILSLITADPRSNLWPRSNRIEQVDGVECYLWRTLLHPFNLARRVPMLQSLAGVMFWLYTNLPCPVLENWACDATHILLESGLAPILFERLKRAAPKAQFIYIASDSLNTLQCDAKVHEALAAAAPAFDLVALPSPLLAQEFPAGVHTAFIPHGIDERVQCVDAPSPFGPGLHAVSVGSMLFDDDFFVAAARARPDIQFHVIGAGNPAPKAPNIIDYGEMHFVDTLPYLQHADLGIAAYCVAASQYYLADTSMKLMQYEALGVPAVCPHFAAGGKPHRFGYDVGDAASIEAAIAAALQAGRSTTRPNFLSWDDVARRLISPASGANH